MKKIIVGALGICAVLLMGTAQASVIHDVQNGKLVGASGVDVGGTLYNVSFVGTCAEAYSGCDSSLFQFTDSSSAVMALEALFSQVFINNVTVSGVEYNFDSSPELTNGCTQFGFCEIWLPYDFSSGVITSAWHVNGAGTDYLASTDFVTNEIYGNGAAYLTFAKFELMSATLPEPGTAALLGIGLIGLGLARKRKAS